MAQDVIVACGDINLEITAYLVSFTGHMSMSKGLKSFPKTFLKPFFTVYWKRMITNQHK